MEGGTRVVNIQRQVLIVDDEKNIRLTLVQCLEPFGFVIDLAVNGEEALQKIQAKKYAIVLLDLKMPGMSGMEVLRRISEQWSDIKVIVITAHGSIETAVESMKLGAVDFVQKPFAPGEIRDLIQQVLNRDELDEHDALDYAGHLNLAKKAIGLKQFDSAIEHVRNAIALDPSKPEMFNMLGVLLEIKGDTDLALKNFKAAISLDPMFEAARVNLKRVSEHDREFDLSDSN